MSATVQRHPAAYKKSDVIIPLGYDDGFNNTKIVGPNGVTFCIPNRVRRGAGNTLALGKRQANIAEFKIGNTIYSAGDVNGESTTFDDYPTSDLNRVASHHALYEAGYGGQKLKIASGLPIKLFYKGGKHTLNDTFIEQKKANLTGELKVLRGGPNYPADLEPFQIVKHEVTVEGLVAWFHILIEETGGGKFKFHKDRQKLPMGFVDMGGRTADLAVVCDGVVDMARSSSINRGMLDVRRLLRESIQSEYDLTEVSDNMVDIALTRQKIELYGSEQDVSGLVRDAKETVIGDIRDEARRRFGKGAELSEVTFFGGAYHDFESILKQEPWFPHQRAAEQPLFVNALGMYKYISYVAK